MKQLESPLIKDRSKRLLSALGFKQLYRIAYKAAEANNMNRYSKEFKPIYTQVERLVMALIFDHNITKEQLSNLQKQINVVDNTLQLPSIATIIN